LALPPAPPLLGQWNVWMHLQMIFPFPTCPVPILIPFPKTLKSQPVVMVFPLPLSLLSLHQTNPRFQALGVLTVYLPLFSDPLPPSRTATTAYSPFSISFASFLLFTAIFLSEILVIPFSFVCLLIVGSTTSLFFGC